MARKKIVAMDFDGVINPYKEGWKGPTYIPEAPVEGIKELIAELRNDYSVYIFSTRVETEEGMEAVKNYLEKHGIIVDKITNKKPKAFVTIDDRVICFKGTTSGLKEQIDNFKPWNK